MLQTLRVKLLGEEIFPRSLVVPSTVSNSEDDEYEDNHWRVISFSCEGARNQKMFSSIWKKSKRKGIEGRF